MRIIDTIVRFTPWQWFVKGYRFDYFWWPRNSIFVRVTRVGLRSRALLSLAWTESTETVPW